MALEGVFEPIPNVGSNILLEPCVEKLQEMQILLKKYGFVPVERHDIYLTASARHGFLDLVKFFFKSYSRLYCKNADINDWYERKHKNMAMIAAAASGHLDVVKYFIKKKCPAWIYDDAAIGMSATNGHIEVVEYLMKKSNTAWCSKKAIYGSCENGHTLIFKLLFKRAGPFLPSSKEDYVNKAIPGGHLDIIRCVIASEYPDAELPENDIFQRKQMSTYFNSAADRDLNLNKFFRMAAEYGHLSIVKYFSKIHRKLYSKKQLVCDLALVKSARSGHLDVVKYLVKNKHDPTALSNECLVQSACNGHTRVVKILLKYGCFATKTLNEIFLNAVHLNHLGVVKALVKAGCNVNYLVDMALYHGAINQNFEIVRYLITVGCDHRHAMEVISGPHYRYQMSKSTQYLFSLQTNRDKYRMQTRKTFSSTPILKRQHAIKRSILKNNLLKTTLRPTNLHIQMCIW
jgi:ankyrin repeat protein